MMRFCFLVLGIFFLFFSCSNSQNVELSNFSDETLRDVSSKIDDEILWTRELESVRLTRDFSKNQVVSNSLALTPSVISVAETRNFLVFPVLQDFGNLDVTEISDELFAFINSFCDSVCRWSLEDIKIEKDSEFSLILFKFDVEESWSNVFNEKFPVLSDDEKLFLSYKVGTPFFYENSIQIPLRFYKKTGTLDVLIYVNNDSTFIIQNIEIKRMG